jgi:hypothetical protein
MGKYHQSPEGNEGQAQGVLFLSRHIVSLIFRLGFPDSKMRSGDSLLYLMLSEIATF